MNCATLRPLICESEEVARKMTENLEKDAGCLMDLEEAEQQAASDVVAQREEALAKKLAEMKRRKTEACGSAAV